MSAVNFNCLLHHLARSGGDIIEACQSASVTKSTPPQVAAFLKSATDVGTTSDSDFAAPLAGRASIISGFLGSLENGNLVDRGLADRAWFPGVLRQSTIVVSTAALAYETGEGMIKNMTQLGIGNPFTLDSFKVVGAMAVTRETVRMAVP